MPPRRIDKAPIHSRLPAPVAQGIERAPPEREVAGSNPAGRMTRSTHTYGSDPSQLGELFLPSGAGPHPVAVVVHGGYWRAQYDRSLMTDLCIDLARARRRRVEPRVPPRRQRRRLAGDVPRRRGRQSTCSPSSTRRSISRASSPSATRREGSSRSGRRHAGRCRRGAGSRTRASAIRAAVSQAGVLDLTLAAGLMPSSTPTRALLGDPEEHYDRYVLASPRERLPLGIPQLVLHGDRDDIVSMRIATSYAAAARDAGDPCELLVLTHTGHFEHIDAGSHAWHVARDWLVAQSSARAQLSDEALERRGPVLGGEERRRADDHAVRELGGRGRLLRCRDAEAGVERHVGERARPLDERGERRRELGRARPSSRRR